MTTTHHEHESASPVESRMDGALKVALLMVAVIAGFYLLREHWSHVTGNWIYLLLLACPLMHLFHGHGRHGGHGGHDGQGSGPRNENDKR